MTRSATDHAYFPTLTLRPAEMRALSELPSPTKQRFIPIMQFAPWIGSKHLHSAVDKLTSSYNLPQFVDLDRTYAQPNEIRPAARDFFKLRDSKENYKSYREFIENNSTFIPVIQSEGICEREVLDQINWASEIGRGFLVRVLRGPHEMQFSLLSIILDQGMSNFAIHLDAGWTDNVSNIEQNWLLPLINEIQIKGTSVPIITSAASFPKQFGNIEGSHTLPIGANALYDSSRRRFSNQLNIKYGDWASARPRSSGGGGIVVPRIDIPDDANWFVFRNKGETSYKLAASTAINSGLLNQFGPLWGKQMIEKTQAGDVTGITNPARATAARINMHLFRQSWRGSPGGLLSTDEPAPSYL